MKKFAFVLGLLATFGFAGSVLADHGGRNGAAGGLETAIFASEKRSSEGEHTAAIASGKRSAEGLFTGLGASRDAEGPDRLAPIGASNSGEGGGSHASGR